MRCILPIQRIYSKMGACNYAVWLKSLKSTIAHAKKQNNSAQALCNSHILCKAQQIELCISDLFFYYNSECVVRAAEVLKAQCKKVCNLEIKFI